ncbi:MAG: hypothetical protein ACTSWX_04080 [Promethearchaeota archaeon]
MDEEKNRYCPERNPCFDFGCGLKNKNEKSLKKNNRRKKFFLVFGILAIIGMSLYIGFYVPPGQYNLLPEESKSMDQGTYNYEIPLDEKSLGQNFGLMS